jgi:hypothetical protein
MRSTRVLAMTVLCVTLGGRLAARADEDVTGTRALGMGDALRAAAVGAAGLHLNPSGLTLLRSYVVESAFEFGGGESAKYFDVSVSDSITARGAGGVYFDYLSADIKDGGMKVGERSGWEVGLAAAYPLADWISFGILPKYQSIDQPAQYGGKADGFTLDTGITVRPVSFLNLAAVGANLVEQDSTRAPRTFGLGLALNPIAALLIGFDVVWDFDTVRLLTGNDRTEQAYHVGGEFLIAQKLALRAGYITDGATGRDFVSWGGSLVTPQVSLDFGGRTQVDGPGDQSTLFSVSLRLFLQ